MASRFSAAHVYEKAGRQYRYRYRAVTAMGAGIHSKDYVDLGACRRLVDGKRGVWPDLEVERVREFVWGDGSVQSRQYELERNGRWISATKLLREHPSE